MCYVELCAADHRKAENKHLGVCVCVCVCVCPLTDGFRTWAENADDADVERERERERDRERERERRGGGERERVTLEADTCQHHYRLWSAL